MAKSPNTNTAWKITFKAYPQRRGHSLNFGAPLYLTPEIVLGDLTWAQLAQRRPRFDHLDGGRHGERVSRKAMRREWRKQHRELVDMPPRGDRAAWEAAFRHGSTIPEDAVRLYVCTQRHHYFFVGPSIDYKGAHLIRLHNPGYETLPVEVRCSCHSPSLALKPIPRNHQKILRALWRMGGELAVRDALEDVALRGHAVNLAHFKYVSAYTPVAQRWRRWSDGFPESPMLNQIIDRKRRIE